MKRNDVEQETLRFAEEERANFAQKFLLSLDDLFGEELKQAWLAEADRRARERDRGEVRPIPADAVQRKVQALLR